MARCTLPHIAASTAFIEPNVVTAGCVTAPQATSPTATAVEIGPAAALAGPLEENPRKRNPGRDGRPGRGEQRPRGGRALLEVPRAEPSSTGSDEGLSPKSSTARVSPLRV